MTLRLRFTLLLGLLLGGFLVALFVVQRMEQAERAELLAEDRRARAQLLEHWIEAAARELPQFALEVAQSEDFEKLLREPVTAGTRPRLATTLAKANASGLWILGGDGGVVLASDAQGLEPPLPLEGKEAAALLADTPMPRFFVERNGTLLEIVGRRLQTTDPRRWVLVARPWDAAHLRTLSELTDSTATLHAPHDRAEPPAADGKLVLQRPLNDWRGRTVRVLRLDYELPAFARTLRSDAMQVQLFIVFGLTVLGGLTLALQSWVLRPLQRIRESLASDTAAPVADLSKESSEFGRVAQLVLSSFAQREALRLEIAERTRAQEALVRSDTALRQSMEERARLGRDLHDGVIQSLYAAGMGLAGIRDQLRPDQVEAAARLEQTRGALNETIHDVRNFIVGLEPESLKVQSFSQAVAALLDTMSGMRAFESRVTIDDGLAARLTLAQRVHALQIAREAVSNALRHGKASRVDISLREQEHTVEFSITDDGCGFDASSATAHGNGLGNFAERARELGAEFTVESQINRGTSVKLTFSLL
jgi:signal transduction histidine kinase